MDFTGPDYYTVPTNCIPWCGEYWMTREGRLYQIISSQLDTKFCVIGIEVNDDGSITVDCNDDEPRMNNWLRNGQRRETHSSWSDLVYHVDSNTREKIIHTTECVRPDVGAMWEMRSGNRIQIDSRTVGELLDDDGNRAMIYNCGDMQWDVNGKFIHNGNVNRWHPNDLALQVFYHSGSRNQVL